MKAQEINRIKSAGIRGKQLYESYREIDSPKRENLRKKQPEREKKPTTGGNHDSRT